MNLLGTVTLWGFGVVVGVIGVMALIYWVLDEWRDANDINELVEGVGNRSGSAIVVTMGVLLTIGDQIIQLITDLVGMIDAPVVVGHVVGGILGWLGLQGLITNGQFLALFGIVTVIALIWRASKTSGRGI
ncbi:hypothetical protein EXE53_21185 [Halorubrum sp. SD626R]|uniref:hypothetical protein n=1 Tax=Halorubrum sp. SD626R TaxID=1419722 RepID=UPI0010F9C743|nr:hypothetical protein [Halorubrum sp. SD626R]TKX78438.1 hypothetical protein EXE53_21185 [Halorubrum sp. SD626R]